MTDKTFADLGLSEILVRAAEKAGFTTPTPIQADAIPPALAGTDLLGIAQTGTGKTGAFALPMLDRMSRSGTERLAGKPRALILAPTRELAIQVAQTVQTFARPLNMRYCVIHGGVSQQPQVANIRRGVDVLVATPGRLMDLIEQRILTLDKVETLILDEADRMLDLGFINDIRKISKMVPEKRHTMLFSATMPREISGLAESLLNKPVRVEITPAATPVELIDQSVLFVEKSRKRALLAHLLKEANIDHAIVFARTKHGVDRIVQHLQKADIQAAGLHGDKSQGARRVALESFKSGRLSVLVATDIAARGIDVTGISHVINLDLPNVPETYVHRIGRTARAGRSGSAISFCDLEEVEYLIAIESTTRKKITVNGDHPFHAPDIANANQNVRTAKQGRPGGGRNRSRGAQGPGGGQAKGGQGHGAQAHGGQSHGGQAKSGNPGANPGGSKPRRRRGGGGASSQRAA
jgi:ATP-dependent RNA helicase RhlE